MLGSEIEDMTSLLPAAVADRAAATALEASDTDLGLGLIGLARRLRRECIGQKPGVPDLRRPNASYESLLAWEVLPEMADRLLKRSGAVMARTRAEQDVPSMEIFSDEDLRKSLGDGLKFSRFPEISETLRAGAAPGEIQPGRLLACELVARPIALGNVVAISCARLSPDPMPGTPEADEDWFVSERRRHSLVDDAPESLMN